MHAFSIMMMGGSSQGFKKSIQIPAGFETINLRTLADQAGYKPSMNSEIIFSIPAANYLYGGINTGVWPENKNHKLILNNHGKLYGAGGIGGIIVTNDSLDPNWSGVGSNGSSGGDALYCSVPLTINLMAGGEIIGGGGGGGAGGSWKTTPNNVNNPEPIVDGEQDDFGYGGNGGNGFPFQSAGQSYQDFSAGNGGSGGGPAAAGNNGAASTRSSTSTITAYNYAGGIGGPAGWAIRKNGHQITINNQGGVITGNVA